MLDILAELRWRGLLHTATPRLDAHLREPRVVYCGFDPTAPSLQLGNLVPLMLLRHFQRHGHTPIVLMGGGTGLIGDPSGKRDERPLLAREELRANLERQRGQMERLLQFRGIPHAARLRDNADWLEAVPLVAFLRDVGKHFTINVMLQKESVQARIEKGLSYTEFSYMLLQAYDFLELYRREGCTLQVGGSDQWGNITAGVELIRRVAGVEAHALVAPLVTTTTGVKFGKSEAGAIHLDPAMTSPYKFYQYWINVDDRDVATLLKMFTHRAKGGADGIDAVLRLHAKDPARREAQSVLAHEVTELVHGKDALDNAVAASKILFGDISPRDAEPAVFETLAQEIPTRTATGSTLTLVDAVVQSGLVKSKSEAKRQIAQGGIYVNGDRVADSAQVLRDGDWLAGRNLLLRKGKKEYALLRRG